MGTDIYSVFQWFDGEKWVDAPSKYQENRHYQLFAVLAGVRNGYGFAGVPTGDVVTPISEPRGLPEDFKCDDRDMGDHSFSWLTGDEMLAWAAPKVMKTGILSRPDYEAWDGISIPKDSYLGIWSPDIILINDNYLEKALVPGWTHIQCIWQVDLKTELSYFFDEVKRLVDEYGTIRFVFGFDS